MSVELKTSATAQVSGDLSERVRRVLDDAGYPEAGNDEDFGWRRHRPKAGNPHLVITCEPNGFWRTMPGRAVRTAIAQHLHLYADALAEDGLGVVGWGQEQREVLIVAANQESADRQAPNIIDYLIAQCPPAKPHSEKQDGGQADG